MNRRQFLTQTSKASMGLFLASLFPFSSEASPKVDFEIALAEWSLHKRLFAGEMTNLDFPKVCREEFGLGVVEYVNQFFKDKAQDASYLSQLKQRCDDHGVRSNLIMVDQEGELASTDTQKRNQAIENHKKWVEAAAFLGCASIRVNLHGHDYKTEEEWANASIESLTKLSTFAAAENVNILVENHGQLSSKGYLLARVMKEVNSPNCGTLPDFGNFCVARRDGDMWDSPCVETYDAYKGVNEMMRYAKGVSAKAFAFDTKGNETSIDFEKMFYIILKHRFSGTIGIEYEGDTMSEAEGIKATISLLKRFKR